MTTSTALQVAPAHRSHANTASKHPYRGGGIGCTTCHTGLDRATLLESAVHTPRPKQREEWKKTHHWSPRSPTSRCSDGATEGACLKCHRQEVGSRAPRLNKSLDMLDRAGCFGCHRSRDGDLRKRAADLAGSRRRSPRVGLAVGVEPPGVRPTTWMPKFLNLSKHGRPTTSAQPLESTDRDVSLQALGPVSARSDPREGRRGPWPPNDQRARLLGCHRIGEPDGARRVRPRLRSPSIASATR